MRKEGKSRDKKFRDEWSRNHQFQHLFQVNSPSNIAVLHQNQVKFIVGDQNGAIHMRDLRTGHNEHLIPRPETASQSIRIDRDTRYMTNVNNKGD